MKKIRIKQAINDIFKEIESDNILIQNVLTDKYENEELILSLTLKDVSYEIWKIKNKFKIIRSSSPNDKKDYKITVSEKEIPKYLLEINTLLSNSLIFNENK